MPSQKDYKHFAQRKIMNEYPIFYFNKPENDYQLGRNIGLTNRDLNSTNITLDSFVNTNNTISMIIIRNDTI
ncbi:MAG: hypothetical protein WBB26_08035, partial [Saprospiraceae bacterium]